MDLSEIVRTLTAGLSDNYYPVRDNAARALAKLGTLAEPAIPALVAQLEDEDRLCPFPRCIGIEADSDTGSAERALRLSLYFALVRFDNKRSTFLDQAGIKKIGRRGFQTSPIFHLP